MAQLETLECHGCGFPIGLDQLDKCPRCGEKNFIKTTIDPLVLDQKKINEYIGFYQKKTEDNPKDTNALFAMGLFYLRLQNYELAQRNFKQAVDLSPLEPDMYYYYALSLVGGRSPKNLDHEQAKRTEEWLNTAIKMQRKRKYLALMAFIEQGAFLSNGLQAKEQPDKLIAEALKMVPDGGEMVEISTHVRLTDPTNQEFFEQLQGGKQKEKDEEGIYYKDYYISGYICPYCGKHGLSWGNEQTDNQCYCTDCDNQLPRPPFARLDSWVCRYPSPRDYYATEDIHKGALRLIDPQERWTFLHNLWEPKKPEDFAKPSYPVFKRLWRFAVMLLCTFIFFIIEAAVGYSTKEMRVEEKTSVRQEYRELYGKKNYGAAKRNELMEELRTDSITAAEEEKAFFDEYWIIGYDDADKQYHYGRPDENTPLPYKAEGIHKSYKALLTLLFLLIPFIIWLVKTIVQFSAISRERKSISQQNKARREQYEADLNYFETRPTIQDYVWFCHAFMGKNGVGGKGDLVADALRKSGVDEKDVAGKVLFLNYFDWQDANDMPSAEPEDVLDRIYYVIAIPEKDQLTIYENYWETQYDYVSDCDSESIFYKNITSVKKQDDRILIRMVGGEEKTIMLAPYKRTNILYYQAEKTQDNETFSITRTGNVEEFVKALNKLVASYQK